MASNYPTPSPQPKKNPNSNVYAKSIENAGRTSVSHEQYPSNMIWNKELNRSNYPHKYLVYINLNY